MSVAGGLAGALRLDEEAKALEEAAVWRGTVGTNKLPEQVTATGRPARLAYLQNRVCLHRSPTQDLRRT